MNVATRLSGAFGLFVAILIALLAYHVRTIRNAVATGYALSEISSRLYLSASRQVGRIDQLEENASKFWVTLDDGYLEKFRGAYDAFDATLRELDAGSLATRERAELDRLKALWQAFDPVAAGIGTPADGWTLAADVSPLPRLRAHLDRLRLQAHRLSDASQAAMLSQLQASADAARDAERVSWGAVAGALLFGILVSGVIVRSISDALRRLQEGTRQVAEGNFAYRLELRRADEFSRLAHDFNIMTRRLGELDQMKRDFLSKVSHDLKTPLASMRETTHALLDEVPGPLTPKQHRLLRLNQQSGERLSAMIGKILELSAMEAGALGLEPGRHDLADLVRGAVEPIRAAAAERGVRIITTLPDHTVALDCDGDRITRVLTNLLENAVKFSPPEGEVRITAGFHADRPTGVPADRPPGVPADRWPSSAAAPAPAGAALITVSDAGPGIPDAEKEKIFERFFQSEAGRRVHGRGVGLGLTICREIVDAHHGALWASDRPGGGSTFSVLLPRGEPHG